MYPCNYFVSSSRPLTIVLRKDNIIKFENSVLIIGQKGRRLDETAKCRKIAFTVFHQNMVLFFVFLASHLPSHFQIFSRLSAKFVNNCWIGENRDRCRIVFLNSVPYHCATVTLHCSPTTDRRLGEKRMFESDRANKKLE